MYSSVAPTRQRINTYLFVCRLTFRLSAACVILLCYPGVSVLNAKLNTKPTYEYLRTTSAYEFRDCFEQPAGHSTSLYVTTAAVFCNKKKGNIYN
jgi:hypothetical protein